MTSYNFIGVPFPKDNEFFSEDTILKINLKKISDFVEIKGDIKQAKEAINSLAFSDKKESQMPPIFGFPCDVVRESLLSFAVVLYARAFNSSDGRASLSNKKKEIFSGNEFSKYHKELIKFRNEVYAHRKREHNKYNVMCLILNDKVRINPDSNVRRQQIAYSFDKEKWKNIVNLFDIVISFLDSKIEKTCHNIQEDLTDEQIKYIKEMPRSNFILER